jgi:tetratricopeptide (TPR) repeat protein
MKKYKKRLLLPAVLLAMTVLLFSCASAPAATEETAEAVAETAETGAQNALETAVEATSENADAARLTAEAAREKAVKAKAPRAVPEIFNDGEELLASARSAAESGDFETAVTDYIDAKDSYEEAAAQAEIRKQEALKAMKEADEAIAAVEKSAEEATEEAGGEEQ